MQLTQQIACTQAHLHFSFIILAQFIAVYVSTYTSEAAHAAGMLTVIFLDRGRPDPTSLTFNTNSTALLQEGQLDKKGHAATAGDTNLAGTYQTPCFVTEFPYVTTTHDFSAMCFTRFIVEVSTLRSQQRWAVLSQSISFPSLTKSPQNTLISPINEMQVVNI